MQLQIVQKHIELNDTQKNYIEEKIEHLKKLGERVDDESTQVRVDVESNSIKTSNKNISLQVTIFLPHAVVRAEVFGVTVEEAIDLAIEKLKKQLERYKSKRNRRDQSGKWIPSSTLEEITAAQEGAQFAKIAKRKVFGTPKLMHEEEAIEQMELLDHNFFVFKNLENDRICVVYRREDGTYGLLEVDHQ